MAVIFAAFDDCLQKYVQDLKNFTRQVSGLEPKEWPCRMPESVQ